MPTGSERIRLGELAVWASTHGLRKNERTELRELERSVS